MATCSSCAKEIRDDVWVCGFCGAPATPAAPSGEASPAERYDETPKEQAPASPAAPAAVPAPRPGLSRTTWIVLGAGVVAVLACVAVWFFVLRGGGTADPNLLGTWTPVATASAPSNQAGVGDLTISKSGSGYIFTIAQTGSQSTISFKGKPKGGNLESTLELATGSAADKAAADLLRGIFSAMMKDFRLVFVSESRMSMRLELRGTLKNGVKPTGSTTAEYTRVSP
jgi:hypothetical protein